MNIKLTLDASPKVLANVLILLHDHIDKLEEIPDMAKLATPTVKEASQKTVKPTVDAEAPGASEKLSKGGTPASDIDLETIRKMVIAKTGNHKPEIAALLKTFKAKTLPDLATSDYASFYEQLSAI